MGKRKTKKVPEPAEIPERCPVCSRHHTHQGYDGEGHCEFWRWLRRCRYEQGERLAILRKYHLPQCSLCETRWAQDANRPLCARCEADPDWRKELEAKRDMIEEMLAS